MPTKDDMPVTRGELRATKKDLKTAIARCATRKDLETAIAKCATRKDLETAKAAILAECATRKDLETAKAAILAECATKKDLDAFAQRIVLKLGELMDQVQALKEQSATKTEMGSYASAVDKVSKDNAFLWNKDLVQDERLRGLEDQGKRHADRISSLEGRTSP